MDTRSPRKPYVVVVMEDVLNDLAKLAARARRETVRCLIGFAQNDTAFIEIAWEPRIHESGTTSVQYGGCPVATIAKWLNHLTRFAPSPAEARYLSDMDVADALVAGAPPLQIVQVNEAVMCWWTQEQVAAGRREDFLRPLNNQFTVAGTALATHQPRQ